MRRPYPTTPGLAVRVVLGAALAGSSAAAITLETERQSGG